MSGSRCQGQAAAVGSVKGPFAGASGNDEDAPIPAVRVAQIGRLKSTPFRTFGPAYEIQIPVQPGPSRIDIAKPPLDKAIDRVEVRGLLLALLVIADGELNIRCLQIKDDLGSSAAEPSRAV